MNTHTAGGEPPRIWVTGALAATIAALLLVGTVQVVRADPREQAVTVEETADSPENPAPGEATSDAPEQSDPLAEAHERLKTYVEEGRVHEYYAADGRFRAHFPGLPVREEFPIDVAGVQATMVSFVSEPSEDLAFVVSYVDLPAGSPFDFQAALNGAAVATEGRLESADMTSHDGHGAIDGLIRGEEFFLRARFVKVADRMYTVQVIGLSDPQEAFGTFSSTVSFEMPAA